MRYLSQFLSIGGLIFFMGGGIIVLITHTESGYLNGDLTAAAGLVAVIVGIAMKISKDY